MMKEVSYKYLIENERCDNQISIIGTKVEDGLAWRGLMENFGKYLYSKKIIEGSGEVFGDIRKISQSLAGQGVDLVVSFNNDNVASIDRPRLCTLDNIRINGTPIFLWTPKLLLQLM